jgi:hypothetical protein
VNKFSLENTSGAASATACGHLPRTAPSVPNATITPPPAPADAELISIARPEVLVGKDAQESVSASSMLQSRSQV